MLWLPAYAFTYNSYINFDIIALILECDLVLWSTDIPRMEVTWSKVFAGHSCFLLACFLQPTFSSIWCLHGENVDVHIWNI